MRVGGGYCTYRLSEECGNAWYVALGKCNDANWRRRARGNDSSELGERALPCAVDNARAFMRSKRQFSGERWQDGRGVDGRGIDNDSARDAGGAVCLFRRMQT